MNCPNCKAVVNPGQNFCRICGTKITSSENQFNLPANGVANTNQNLTDNYQNIFQNQVSYQQSFADSDDLLIDAYIGKNATELRKGGFSFCTFFLGIYYVLYRKMWLLGTLWFVGILIVGMFLQSFSTIIELIASIFISISFKEMYLKHVREQVGKIKADNPGKTIEELRNICYKKGGTSILLPIILIIFIFTLSFILVLGNIDNSKNSPIDDQDYQLDTAYIIDNYSMDIDKM